MVLYDSTTLRLLADMWEKYHLMDEERKEKELWWQTHDSYAIYIMELDYTQALNGLK